MDGESIPGPWRCKNVHAECLEFPASWNRNSIAALLAKPTSSKPMDIKDNYPLSDANASVSRKLFRSRLQRADKQ